KHAVWSQWNRRHANADGVGHGVCDRRAWRDRWRFAYTDDSAFVITLAGHHMDLEIADVLQSSNSVKFHVWIEHPAGLRVHNFLFEERIGDAHNHSAEDLALAGLHIDDQAAILHGYEVVHLDNTGFDVH